MNAHSSDAVLNDYLQAAGYRLTVWHVRCVEVFLESFALRPVVAEERLVNDLRGDLDLLQLDAQWEDARWVANRSRPWRLVSVAT